MNIVLIGDGFTGSTLPLAKKWAEGGHKVTCFFYVNVGKGCLEGFDFSPKLLPGIYKVNLNETNLVDYFHSKISVYIIVLLRERKKLRKTGINYLISCIDRYTEKLLLRKIKSLNYDIVNLVGHNSPLDYLIENLDKTKVFCSVHEVLENHLHNDVSLNNYTKWLIKNNIKIIVHSRFCYSKLGDYKYRYYIPFGAFETFKTYTTAKDLNLQPGYLLFYGYILPYKGIGLLYQAYLKDLNKGENIPIVIAGKGNDRYLPLFMKAPNVKVINTYLSNQDIATLIANCKAVVCPYLSASQSGIPQTVNQFGKKVIATNVGAFPEFIYNGENGYVVDVDSADLAYAMEHVESSDFSLSSFLKHHSDLSWDEIAIKYIKLFQNKI